MGSKGQAQQGGRTRVLLSCGCERIFEKQYAPNFGDEMYCIKHEKPVVVKSFQYNWKCRNCSAHKFYGHARVTCEVYASRHALKHQGHVIDLYDLKNQKYAEVGRVKEAENAGFGF